MASLSVQGPYLQRLFILPVTTGVTGLSEIIYPGLSGDSLSTIKSHRPVAFQYLQDNQILSTDSSPRASAVCASGHRRFSALLRSGFSHNGCISTGVARENQDPADVIEQNGRNVGTGREGGGQEADSENYNQQGDHRNPRGA